VAAACVAVIVVAALVASRVVAGPPGGGAATGLAGAPRFFAGLTGEAQDNALNIYRSATGRVVASVPAPRPDREFEAVARLGGDRMYVVAAVASSRACTTQLYGFTIGPGGRPSGLTPLSVPQITGMVMELVGSADGNVLAYALGGLWPDPAARPGRSPPAETAAGKGEEREKEKNLPEPDCQECPEYCLLAVTGGLEIRPEARPLIAGCGRGQCPSLGILPDRAAGGA
jgi:hypothetical protein